MVTKYLNKTDLLPLTCSRKGTCCHGNTVFLNPWEIIQLSNEKKISTQQFIEEFTEDGGIRLKFNGKQDHRGKSACNLYIDDFGCSVHIGRPLACRLFPIGRQIQNEEIQYIHQGEQFPCLNGCPEVINLPKLSLDNYLKGQATESYEIAQDQYLEIVQNLADIAFSLLLDTGLAASGETEPLKEWRKMGEETPVQLAKRINKEWHSLLLSPPIKEVNDPIQFTLQHNELLQEKAQSDFEKLSALEEIKKSSIEIMAITLYLSKSIGADLKSLVEHWIEIAKENGAKE